MDISVVIPLFNEEESLGELIAWIEKVCKKHQYTYEAILIDDGSTDNSWSIVESLSEQYAAVIGIKFRRNYGKSAALNVGFEAAKGNVVITMDADLQDNPEEIPGLFDMVMNQNYHLVSGWKKKRKDPLNKRIPSKFFNKFTQSVSGIKLHDFNCGLKAYKKDVVKNIEVYGEMHRYIPVIAKWHGFTRIGELVVNHMPRKYGVTKFGMERYMKGFLDLLSITFVSKFGKRPMHLFGTLGSVLFMVGFVIAGYLAFAKLFLMEYNMTERPLFYLGILSMILGGQLFMTGFLAEMLSRMNTDRNKYSVEKYIGIETKETVQA